MKIFFTAGSNNHAIADVLPATTMDSNKAKNNLKLLEAKNRHLETYSSKLKENLSQMNSMFQSAKKESHKHKLQIKLLEQQIKNLIKRSA